jgi:hypothetical protein
MNIIIIFIIIKMTFVTDLFVFHEGVNTILQDYWREFRASEFKKFGWDFTLVKRLSVCR